MRDYLSNISKFYDNSDNANLYNEWVKYNSYSYMKYFIMIALAITAVLIPFDFFLYDSPTVYSSIRVILMVLYIFLLLIVFKFFNKKTSNHSFNFIILIPSLSYNIVYSYFLYQAEIGASYYKILLPFQ